ncbi:hypothetical protein [Brooklawnia cerclae]|uniref:Uncharacterized protein n=1 Tax=Brooklawnia cerclae TaxID=349934 RepID=A0ABX0SE73_9ACTN|nr:hypothetical protein [Brooklawnia cerclae]NIH56266.1 hypothetical protein [Brooklawnia cerclae]
MAGRKTPRGVRAHRCRTCRAPVLSGLDNDRMAFQVSVDWQPLDATGELVALLAGRATFRIEPSPSGNPRLTRRTAEAITRPRRWWEAWDIIPEHRCGAPPLPTAGSRLLHRPGFGDLPADAPAPF